MGFCPNSDPASPVAAAITADRAPAVTDYSYILQDLKAVLQRILSELQTPGRLPWSMDGETKSTAMVPCSVSGPFRKDIIIFVANNTTVDLKVKVAGMAEGQYLLYPAGTKIPKNVATSELKTALQLEITPSGVDAIGTYHVEVV